MADLYAELLFQITFIQIKWLKFTPLHEITSKKPPLPKPACQTHRLLEHGLPDANCGAQEQQGLIREPISRPTYEQTCAGNSFRIRTGNGIIPHAFRKIILISLIRLKASTRNISIIQKECPVPENLLG